MKIIQLIIACKYEFEKTFRKIRRLVFTPKSQGGFEPLDKRRGSPLDKTDYFYSINLQLKHSWINKYSNQLDETISVLLTDKEKKSLFKELISKFVYVDKEASQRYVQKIAVVIHNKWQCNPNDSVIIAIRKMDNHHPDGSGIFIYQLQGVLKQWRSSRFLNGFDIQNKHVKNSKNIILCDDFIGTGGTIRKRIEALEKVILPTQKIYCVSIAGMKEARTNVLDRKDISYYAPIWLDKGFATDTSNKDCSTMLQIEENLSKKYKEYILETMSLGYKQSGGLYYNEDFRIPNNVFPIFWWGKLSNGQPFKSIFLRS